MPKKFDDALNHLNNQLLAMGAVVEEMINQTLAIMVERKNELNDQVRAHEKELNKYQKEIDDETVRMIAVYTPVAADLRQLLMVSRINSELEKIGDQANLICKMCMKLNKEPPLKPLVDLPRMLRTVQTMNREVLDAFIAKSEEQAIAVIKQDDEVDDLNNQIFRELITYMLEDTRNITRALNLIMISKSVERMGDKAVNIAEDIVYLISGQDIRHIKASKLDEILDSDG